MSDETAAKRPWTFDSSSEDDKETNGGGDGPFELKSMSAPVSPPHKRRREEGDAPGTKAKTEVTGNETASIEERSIPLPALRSPFQLTSIHDLPASANIDTLTIKDVFGDPHVIECWEFNFLHDLDFLMSAFDEGAKQRGIAVHVVHGFWKREDPRREHLETAVRQYAEDNSQGEGNTTITLHTAFMPEPFGTHHTKMAVLFRSDDTAQVVIHTANLIPHDWHNMTQAVWRSPLLPLIREDAKSKEESDDRNRFGLRFKHDFFSYLRYYNQRRSVCTSLVEALERYDFAAIRAVLIGSVPGRHHIPFPDDEDQGQRGTTNKGQDRHPTTHWGWLAMQRALQNVPLRPKSTPPAGIAASEIIVQISSIATLGANDTWLQKTLFAALSGGKVAGSSTGSPAKRLASFGPLRQAQPPLQQQPPKPQFRIIFPTADEIRRSLEGYDSGSSIHAKIQSPQQQKQLVYMKPMLCHWANDAEGGAPLPPANSSPCVGDSRRRRAAPHVKTYIRYSNSDGACHIDWALVTSANLSKQAWGEARSAAGEMRIASYELGVLVWPDMLTGEPGAAMQPVFGRDDFAEGESVAPTANVPLRIPYSLPVQRYGPHEIPWVTSLSHSEPDWRGVTAVAWED